jgi:hypothetical protein
MYETGFFTIANDIDFRHIFASKAIKKFQIRRKRQSGYDCVRLQSHILPLFVNDRESSVRDLHVFFHVWDSNNTFLLEPEKKFPYHG